MAEKGLVRTCAFWQAGCWGQGPHVPPSSWVSLLGSMWLWTCGSLLSHPLPPRRRRIPGVSLGWVPGPLSGAAAGGHCCTRDPPAAARPACRLWAQGLLWGPLFPRYKPSPERMVFPRAYACLNIVFYASAAPPTHTHTLPPPCTLPEPLRYFSCPAGD